MFCLNFKTLSLCATILILSHIVGFAQLSDKFYKDLKKFGEFYENPDSSGLQQAKLFLSYQHQIGHIDGTDQTGQAFDDSFEEFRRFWMGLTGKFGTYWKFKVVSQLSNDRNAYPGDYRQWGHETFRAANITFDADQFWQIEGLDALQFGYGRRTGRMADEWQRSSTVINTPQFKSRVIALGWSPSLEFNQLIH